MNRKNRDGKDQTEWVSGDAEDFLGLTEEKRRLVDLRATLSRTIAELRQAKGLTRSRLARRLKESTAHVAAIEAGGIGLTLESMFIALFAVGGVVGDMGGKPIIAITPGPEYAKLRNG